MTNFDEILNATLNKDNSISVHVHKVYTNQYAKHFYLYCDDIRICELTIQDARETGHHFHYVLTNVPSLTIGAEYKVYDDRYLCCYLNMSVLLRNDRICSLYKSDDVMGAHFHKYYTTFRLFSPLASSAYCVYIKEGKENIVTLEKNTDTGVFQGRASGDLGKCQYYFLVRINGQLTIANDPYCKAVTSQSSVGVIVDPREVVIDLNESYLPKLSSPSDCIIYECSVRDMTSQNGTSIIHKGKFLGLAQPSCKTRNNNPIGLDYLRYLGVTHVQLMPSFDFCTGCDVNEFENYNWGYDPLYYNVPEGSYSSDSKDPYARIIEMKKMVAALHKAGIRVIMDVVYNHVFNMESSCFEKVCPSYYFRFRDDGNLSNGSYCGNEFNTSHPMARKFIVDSCLYWVQEFGIDGFRFDLMGLIDIDTILEVKRRCQEVKSDFIMYGEGWDMPTTLPSSQRSNLNNALRMSGIGFFNDRYRDTVKGKSGDYDLWVKGYLLGDTNYIDGFKHCFLGSALPLGFPPLFKEVTQSINFIECHDNATVFDKMLVSNAYESESLLLKRIKLLNGALVLSCGLPFIHEGQEIGKSKKGIYNSYNAMDDINGFDYDLMDQRFDLVTYLRDIISLRKSYPFFHLASKEKIKETISFKDLPSGALEISYHGKEIGALEEVRVYINPSNAVIDYALGDEFRLLFDGNGLVQGNNKIKKLTIEPISLTIVTR